MNKRREVSLSGSVGLDGSQIKGDQRLFPPEANHTVHGHQPAHYYHDTRDFHVMMREAIIWATVDELRETQR